MNRKYSFEQLVTIAALERHAQKVAGKNWIQILVDWTSSEQTEVTQEMKDIAESLRSEVIEHIEDKFPPAEFSLM